MTTPDVTIVVPAYNVGRYVAACLDSLIAQSAWQRCRVVVINDGSTDDTRRILEDYVSGPQIDVVDQPNAGPGAGAARNHGLDLVDTEYVLFLDGDDELTTDAVGLLVGALDESGLDLAIGATEQFPIGRRWLWSKYFQPGRIDRVRIEEVPQLVHDARTCNKLYRTAPLVASGLRFAEGIHHQDTVVNVPAMLRNPEFMLVGEAVHRYRKRAEGGSVMDSHYTRVGNFWDHLQVVENLVEMLPEFDNSRRLLMCEFIARSFQGFAWRAPTILPDDELRVFFERSQRVVERVPIQSIETATRDALERAAYVTMLENDFDSFLSLDELIAQLHAHGGHLYLAIPTQDENLRALIQTGNTRAWLDRPTIRNRVLYMRLRLRIRGAQRLDHALERIELRILMAETEHSRRQLQLEPTDEPAVFAAEVKLPLPALRSARYRFRLRFGTSTGACDRWVRRPVIEGGRIAPPEFARGNLRQVELMSADNVAELVITEHPLVVMKHRALRAKTTKPRH